MLKYGPTAKNTCSLQVLGFPCSQFAHQEPGRDDEIMNTLKYVRPGHGFAPNFTLFSKLDVNGDKADPFFKWVKTVCPRPDATIATTANVLWSPIQIGDIRWNFEKFLFDHNGKPYKRYNEMYLPLLMDADIKALLDKCDKDMKRRNKYHIPESDDLPEEQVSEDFEDPVEDIRVMDAYD